MRSETHLFIVFADHVIQRIGRRRFHRGRLRRCGCIPPWEAGFRDRCHFRCGGHDDADGQANKRASSSAFTSLADALLSKTTSPVGDVSLNAGVPSIAAQCLELSHRELAGSPDVYRAHQCDIFGHMEINSRAATRPLTTSPSKSSCYARRTIHWVMLPLSPASCRSSCLATCRGTMRARSRARRRYPRDT